MNNAGIADPVIRLEASKVGLLARVLSDAFEDAPHIRYAIPDDSERRAVLPLFLEISLRAADLCGESYATRSNDGGAVWIGPNNTLSVGGIVQQGLSSARFKPAMTSLRRCLRLAARLERVRRRLTSSPHWYLVALGVAPSERRRAVCAALLKPGLYRADSDGLPCYLETFEEQDIAFYEEYGFRIEGGGRISGGPAFWAMLRSPRLEPC